MSSVRLDMPFIPSSIHLREKNGGIRMNAPVSEFSCEFVIVLKTEELCLLVLRMLIRSCHAQI